LPSDGVVQISFDRYLLPTTITRQSYLLLTAAGEPIPNFALRTIYDPVARTVAITGPEGPGVTWLTEGAFYRLVLPVAPAEGSTDVGGFRAIDRAPLAAGRTYLFRATAPSGVRRYEPAFDFCADVLPIFVRKCSTCHAPGETALAGLVLSSPDGLRRTAIGRVAQGSNTAALAGSPAEQGPVFGINMPIIEPGDPGSSWLTYKIELAPLPVVDAGAPPEYACGPASTAAFAPIAPYRAAALDDERAILAGYVLGREMPYPTARVGPTSQPLTFDERERVRVWIANGANVRECGCPSGL